MPTFNTLSGTINLARLPLNKQEKLQAWDAADELLLNHLNEHSSLDITARVLLINDQFGALACGLHRQQQEIVSWSDSFIAHLSTQYNLELNQQTQPVTYLPSTESPVGTFDWVLIKIPKTLALLEHQLISLKPHLTKHTIIIATGMVKYLQKSHQNLLEQYLGSTKTSLAVKKARLYFCQNDQHNAIPPSPYPEKYYLEELNLHLSNHANVFSREKLDIGSRFLLQQFEQLPAAEVIVDLGCGNGVLGICAQRQLPDSEVYFVDESYMAIASAKENYQQQFGESSSQHINRHFVASDCLQQLSLNKADLILCNPPFHQNNTIGDEIAWRMFTQSKRMLGNNGVLWVVGNRHLNYHHKLKRVFNHCRTVASNKKFVILMAQQQPFL